MTKPPNVSVIIPCYNHGEFLPEAVGSVTAMNRDDVELVVVDDGSTDERTRAEMARLTASGIQVIRQENKGLSAARNTGILASNGRYILPLDADDRLRPAYVEHGIRILDAKPNVGVVYGDGEYFGIRTGRWRLGPFNENQLLKHNFIACCAVFRRLIWEQNHGYDDAPIFEDWDFWLGALEHGWQFEYVPEVLFDYRVAKESMATRKSGPEMWSKITRAIASKHGPLYRDVFLQLQCEHESVRGTFRNLRRLLKARLNTKFRSG